MSDEIQERSACLAGLTGGGGFQEYERCAAQRRVDFEPAAAALAAASVAAGRYVLVAVHQDHAGLAGQSRQGVGPYWTELELEP